MELKEFNLDTYKDFKSSMFIQASAGTGKTYTITGIIEKLINAGINLSEILVVTYTEKAAGELRDRIRSKCPTQDIDNAPIFTIHSFCQKTLSEFSFTANQCANLKLTEDNALYDFIDRWIRDNLKNDAVFQGLYNYADNGDSFINSLIKIFKQSVSNYYLNNQGKEEKSIVSLDTEHFTIISEQIISFADFDHLINPQKPDDYFIIDGFENAWKNLEENIHAKKAAEFKDEIINNITNNHIFFFDGHKFQNRMVGDEIKDSFDFLRNFKEIYNKKILTQVDEYTKAIFLNDKINELYLAWQQEKEKNKTQSFNDMLRNVREAVCSKESELKKQLQKKYKYAIIDEFQDTNQKQWDIFKTIFMEDEDHTIIVVGDPKQSIYAFQGADVNVYKKAVEEIEKNKGIPYNLITNYRSTDAMVNGCNLLFKNFFDPKNINFIESKPSGKKPAAMYCNEKTEPIWIAGTQTSNATEKDFARITAQTIIDSCTWENGKTKLQVLNRNVTFKDFAILVRSSNEYAETERALKKAGIPYTRYKDANLFLGKECIQWISLFNAIIADDFTGANRAILSEALFTDFFDIPFDKVKNEEFDNPSCLQRQFIIQWQQLAHQRKWAKLIETIFADTKIENRLSQLDKMHSLTKIRQIGNYVVDYLYKNDSSLEDASKHLLRLSTKSDSSIDNGNIVEKGTDFDCVQLMTIHSSKGLEFPVVIVPAGLTAKRNITLQASLYHDDERNTKLGFTPYAAIRASIEDSYERERIFYVAYTRASSILVLPFYDIWDPSVSDKKAANNIFLKNSISSLFDAKDENGKSFVRILKNNNKSDTDLQKEVQLILQESKKHKQEQSAESQDNGGTEDSQLTASKKLSEKVPSLSIYKHSYSSLSHKKMVTEEMTENGGRADKEGADSQQVSLAGFDATPNPVSYVAVPGADAECLPAAAAPYNFPKGTKLGIALHEVFERADFSAAQEDEGLRRLITACFEKQTLSIPEDDPDQWLAYTSSLVWNTLNATLPEISGVAQTGNYFKLSELAAADRISEAEFNMNVDITESTGITARSAATASTNLLKNYCNGFIDLVFKRSINGRDVYSILDWKSDTFEAGQYSDGTLLKAHTDDRYSIQRVLYSYSLIKWLTSFYKDETEAQVFENHFGGIYYAYVRGCHADTCSGIYARTWKSWQELENAFKKIMGAEHESR